MMWCFQIKFLTIQLMINLAVIFYSGVRFKKKLRNFGWVIFPLLSVILTYAYLYYFDIPESQKSYVSGKSRCGNGEIGFIIVQYFALFIASFILQILSDILSRIYYKKDNS